MLYNHLKLAFRNLTKNSVFSVINILGLALGITTCLLIVQYVTFEKSYDGFHEHADRLFRVAMFKYEKGEPEQTFAFTYPAVAPHLKEEMPEIEEAVRVRRTGFMVSYENVKHSEVVYFVDKPFLEMFSFPMIQGNRETALDGKYAVVISEEMAQKYFGTKDPMGKQLKLDAGGQLLSFEVTGVLENVPENSHIDFDFLLPYATYSSYVAQFGADAENNWGWSDFYTYVQLRPGAQADAVQAKLPAFIHKYKGDEFEEYGYEIALRLQPLTSIHLHSDLAYELRVNGSSKYILALGLIALFILIIAWINYINLSTANAIDRSKEVGVRKVVGATRPQLMRQFLMETFLVNLVALMLAVLLFKISFPSFEQLVGKSLGSNILGNSQWFLLLTGLLLAGTLLAGLYPAFIMSGFTPLAALRQLLKIGNISAEKGGLRRSLVFVQFVASVALIAGSLTFYQQMQFMRNTDLGVNIDQMLVLQENMPRDSTHHDKLAAFESELLANPQILNFTASGDVPGKEVGGSWNLRRVKDENRSLKRCRVFEIDPEFVPNYELELLAGRNFSEAFGTDSESVLLNATAVRVLGFESPEAAVGEEIANPSGDNTFRVIGVLDDYHQESLKFPFKPIVYFSLEDEWEYYSMRINTTDVAQTIAFVEQKWQSHFPDAPLTHFFLDDFFARQYQSDVRFGQIVALFTLLGIFIACLGLFGLSSFSVTRRTKEIGIRKVLGANTSQILILLSQDYFRLIILASVIALPLAYWQVGRWLDNYAYAVKLGWWFFLLPVLLVMLIAALTVAYQSVKAAVSNPIKSLRYE